MITDWQWKLMNGAFRCPNTGEVVPAFSSEDDDKFMCESCGGTHIRKLCRTATRSEADAAGLDKPKWKR